MDKLDIYSVWDLVKAVVDAGIPLTLENNKQLEILIKVKVKEKLRRGQRL